MCYCCVHDPFELIYNVVQQGQRGQLSDKELLEAEAWMIKFIQKDAEKNGPTCDLGSLTLEALKARQYELSRLL